jgi:ABC-type glycerol-3-phosphate transport system substrate-binding protein
MTAATTRTARGFLHGQRNLTRRGLGARAAAVAAMAGMAAACAPGATTTESNPGASKGPVTIDVLTRSGVTSPTGHSQWYAQVAKNSFTPQTNITVNLIDADSVTEKLTVMASAGTPPDGSWFATLADGSGGREQAIKGIFKPLDDLMKKDSKFDIKPYFKSLIDLFTVNGKVHALTLMAHYGTNVLYYNKQKTQSAGVTVPADGNWTVDEFVAAATKLVSKGQDTWGFWPDLGMAEFGAFWVRQFGGEFLDEAGKKCLLDSPEARAGMEWVYNCSTKFQLIDNQYRTGSSKTNMFEMEGKLAFLSTTPGLVAEYRKPDQQRVKFDLGIALFPKGPKGHGTQGSGSGVGMTNTAKQAAVWEWIKTITNRENGVGQVFGGAGSPGGRTDVWNDPKMLAFDPIYSNIIKAYPQGAGSIRWPANNRRVDVLKAGDDELAKYFRGETSLADATSKATAAVNAVLSQ